MKRFFFIAVLLALLAGPAGAILDVQVQERSTNYIIWNWSAVTLTGISIDGVKETDFDPSTTYFILSDLNPGEAHSISLYTAGDAGTNATKTQAESQLINDVPIGLWIYALVGVIFLVLARLSQVRFINIICIIFGLIGAYSLIGIKETMDPSIWLLTLIVYMILLIAGGAAYLYGSGRR